MAADERRLNTIQMEILTQRRKIARMRLDSGDAGFGISSGKYQSGASAVGADVDEPPWYMMENRTFGRQWTGMCSFQRSSSRTASAFARWRGRPGYRRQASGYPIKER